MLTLKGRRVPLRLVPTLFLLSNHEDLADDDNHEDDDGDGDEDDGAQENEDYIAHLFGGYYEKKNTRMLSSPFLGINMKKSIEI